MTQVTVRGGIFVGMSGELIERGERASKVALMVFGRRTVVDVSNDDIAFEGEAFDPFSSFASAIRTDRHWETGEASNRWWLEQREVTAETWEEHLRREAARAKRVDEEAARLLEQLRAAVGEGADWAEIDAYFRQHEEDFRPYRVQWRKSHEATSPADRDLHTEALQQVDRLQRRAFRAWWRDQPRSAESCAEFLQAAWASDDYQAWAAAEHEAFDRWGREAVELIFNHYRDTPLEVRDLDALAAGHPWAAYHGQDPGEAVRRIFDDVWELAPEMFERFAYAVRAIYTFERNAEPCLLYACDATESHGDRRTHVSLVVGGPALDEDALRTVDERLSEYVRSRGWKLPAELRAFYRIHHGMGRLSSWGLEFDNAGSIYPAEQLSVVGEIMNEIAVEQGFEPQGYAFDDLLAFFEDGAGNSENFFRHGADAEPSGTVDWDHETREVSSVRSFWAFLGESPKNWWFGE